MNVWALNTIKKLIRRERRSRAEYAASSRSWAEETPCKHASLDNLEQQLAALTSKPRCMCPVVGSAAVCPQEYGHEGACGPKPEPVTVQMPGVVSMRIDDASIERITALLNGERFAHELARARRELAEALRERDDAQADLERVRESRDLAARKLAEARAAASLVDEMLDTTIVGMRKIAAAIGQLEQI